MKERKSKIGKHKIKLRHIKLEDYEDISHVMKSSYPTIGGMWKREQLEKLLTIFPEGQICVEDKGKVVAFSLSLIIDYSMFGDDHTYSQIVGNYEFSTHNKKGDVLYGIEICVHPDYRGLRIGRRIYDARKSICEKLNLNSIIAGGRMPKYADYAEKMTPRQYIERVKQKEIYDPVLSFQLSNDFHVKKVLKNYLPLDEDSKYFATLIEWNNIYFKQKPRILSKKSIVRVGVVQWQMRPLNSIESLFENAEFFVDAVSGYKADFLLFPELFNAALMSEVKELDPAKAIREIVHYTEEIRNRFVDFAISYNINIIAGSLPLYENGNLYNAAYLCRRDGSWDMQYKLHITPNERDHWGMVGGNRLSVFETDVAKIGILICYDVEFPELGRIMAEKGLEILFVPFLTDTQNGFHRVNKCAQARAIENECYVAIAGSVGNLPKVVNMDIQYAQSAIFSPSDFAFPTNAVVSETTPNTEMTIIADLDLDFLKELHTKGSVRNLLDKRKDLYKVEWIKENVNFNALNK